MCTSGVGGMKPQHSIAVLFQASELLVQDFSVRPKCRLGQRDVHDITGSSRMLTATDVSLTFSRKCSSAVGALVRVE